MSRKLERYPTFKAERTTASKECRVCEAPNFGRDVLKILPNIQREV